MDWNAAIEKNREALKRVVAMLVTMAEMAGGSSTLPRHLYRAVLRPLRPAESAARRLIIVAARGLVVSLPPPRKPKPRPMHAALRSLGIAVVVSPGDLVGIAAARQAAAARAAGPNRLSLPLLDPLRSPFRLGRTYVPARAVPRIWSFGATARHAVPPPSSRDDPVDASRLKLRLAALASALDNLPAQARRFARWKARRDAGLARRLWPFRPGRPPGSLAHRHRRTSDEVHDILDVVHGLAFWSLERPRSHPDTS